MRFPCVATAVFKLEVHLLVVAELLKGCDVCRTIPSTLYEDALMSCTSLMMSLYRPAVSCKLCAP